MAIQHIRFETGGFVLHKIRLQHRSGLTSAWYSPTGELLDCERRNGQTSGIPVTDEASLNELKRLGVRYAEANRTK